MFLLWLRVAAGLYAIASISALPAVLYDKPGWKKLCVPAAVGGFFFHFVSLIEMLAAAHHSLPVGMHEVQSLLALLICAAFLLVALLYRTVSFGIIALPLSLLLVLGPAMGPDHWTFQSPGIRSGWISAAYRRPAGRLCRAHLQPDCQLPLPGSGTPPQEQKQCRFPGLVAAARDHGAHCLRYAADRVPFHDPRFAGWVIDRPGERGAGLF